MWRFIAIVSILFTNLGASASSITIAGFAFADGAQAFADDAFLVAGVIRYNCATAAAGPASSVAEAVTGTDLERCINNDRSNSGVVEILFTDNRIENGAGPDLVVFELSGSLPVGTADPRERFGVSVFDGSGFSSFAYYDPVSTGSNSCGDPSLCLDTFAVQIDLSSFGLAAGSFVDRVRLHIYDVGLGTKSADVAALGALHSAPAVPEPTPLGLVAFGLLGLGVARRGRHSRPSE